MPAIQPGSKVLLTSGSGFLGSWTVNELLKRGYSVRTTVRSTEKGEYLQQLFSKYGAGKFEYVIAEDLEKPGVFDQAVVGVQAVLHTGSPFHFETGGDPHKSLINPAVNGTKAILQSIVDHGKDVKRVVLTSSYAAVVTPIKPPATLTVDDWNTHAPAELEKKGKDTDGGTAYRASKTLAEQAAWEFVKTKSPQFDLITVNPPLILGPIIHQVASADALNTSCKMHYDVLSGSKPAEGLSNSAGNYVDVRDVADVHVLALSSAEAGGQRLPASASPYSWQDIADTIQDSSSIPADVKSKATKGEHGAGKQTQHVVYDGSKAQKLLGIKYKLAQQITDDFAAAIADYEKRGWKGQPDAKLLDL